MYKKQKHLHFLGVGGIGMSGIAEILKKQGFNVSGCDLAKESKTLNHLSSLGCKIYCGHDPKHSEDADVLVYSSAITQDNPEVMQALKKGIPVIPRAIMLAEIMRTKHSVAISGAHGKTTTTSMLSHVFIEAALDPTVIIGGMLKNISANAKLGRGNILIAEADESDRSLLYLNPTIAVITNIDAEHLDTYKNLEDVQETFKNFLARVPFYGKAFVCIDDKPLAQILPIPHVQTIKYGLSENADIMGEIISLEATYSIFNVYDSKDEAATKSLLGQVKLNMAGAHNVLNALAATAVSLEFDIPFRSVQKALASFGGIERRFEFKGLYRGAEVFDDYGHHPTELEQTFKIAKRRKKNRFFVVFQPHRYSRTEKLWDLFIDVLLQSGADEIYLADIYPASEKPIEKITSNNLVRAILSKNPNLKISHCSTFEDIEGKLKGSLNQGDLLLTIGAGKIYVVGENLINSKS